MMGEERVVTLNAFVAKQNDKEERGGGICSHDGGDSAPL